MKKLLSIAILISILVPAASAITVEEITTPKPPAARLGTGHTPEKAFKITESTKKKRDKNKRRKLQIRHGISSRRFDLCGFEPEKNSKRGRR